MNPSMYKKWRALLHRLIVKLVKKRTDTFCVFTHSGKVQKEGSVNTHNDLVTTSNKWADNKKTNLIFVFCNCFNVFKF